MLIQQKIGNIGSFEINNRKIDTLPLAWYETNKRILHKNTVSGIKISLKFLKEDPEFTQGDIIFYDKNTLVLIDIIPCDTIIIRPGSMYRMASLCYEIGNKHLPLFINQDEVLVPYESPLFNWLTVAGFEPARESRQLLHPLRTTTIAHSHNNSGGLFTKIMQLTKTP